MNINRNTSKYRTYLKNAKKYNGGKCELTEESNNLAVHHLYSIRKYPELAYHPDNAILLNKELHKEYHRKYSPYETNGYTFLAWLHSNATKFGISSDSINRLSKKVHLLMNTLEKEIAINRFVDYQNFNPNALTDSITKKKDLNRMQRKADKLVNKLNNFETIEIIGENCYIINVYSEGFVIYRNDYGNWNEYNPISGSIIKNVYNAVMNI